MLMFGAVSALRLQGEDKAVIPLSNAHAHNDYEHTRPLLDALAHGFRSVEADIYLVNDALLVAHDLEDVLPDKSLEALYLDPLLERTQQYGGKVYPNGNDSFLLLIDLKSEGAPTYHELHSVLEKYQEMLTEFRDGEKIERGVTVIVSGDRPREVMESQQVRFAAYDGRLADLEEEPDPAFMPLVSDNWRNHFTWLGQGGISPKEHEKLKETVQRVHGRGQMIRFWATPDNESVWRVLRDAKVDLINTDNLAGLRDFLLEAPTSE